MLSEARKFGVAIVSANQFLDQYPPEMRAAIFAVGTHIFFQLSSGDAGQIAQAVGGGRQMSELLKNLPRRHFVMKSGPDRAVEVKVPQVIVPPVDYTELVTRSHGRWARSRVVIEREIAKRHELRSGSRTNSFMTGNNGRGIVLQARDRQLLQELAVMRVVDREQAKIVAGFGSTTRANVRLLALTRAGLLRRFFLGAGAGRKALYAMSAKGAQLVGVPMRGPRRQSDEVLVADFFVQHQLTVNEIYCP